MFCRSHPHAKFCIVSFISSSMICSTGWSNMTHELLLSANHVFCHAFPLADPIVSPLLSIAKQMVKNNKPPCYISKPVGRFRAGQSKFDCNFWWNSYNIFIDYLFSMLLRGGTVMLAEDKKASYLFLRRWSSSFFHPVSKTQSYKYCLLPFLSRHAGWSSVI